MLTVPPYPLDDPESQCQEKLAATLHDWITNDHFCASSLVEMRALVAQMLDSTPEAVARGQEPNGQWLRRLHGALIRDLTPLQRRTCIRRSLEFIGLATGREPYVLGAARWQRIRSLIDQVCDHDAGGQLPAATRSEPQPADGSYDWARLAITAALCGLLSPQRTRLAASNLACLGLALDELRAAMHAPVHTPRSSPDEIGLHVVIALEYSEMSVVLITRVPEVVLASLGLLGGEGLQLLGPVNWMKVSTASAKFRQRHAVPKGRPGRRSWWRKALNGALSRL